MLVFAATNTDLIFGGCCVRLLLSSLCCLFLYFIIFFIILYSHCRFYIRRMLLEVIAILFIAHLTDSRHQTLDQPLFSRIMMLSRGREFCQVLKVLLCSVICMKITALGSYKTVYETCFHSGFLYCQLKKL